MSDDIRAAMLGVDSSGTAPTSSSNVEEDNADYAPHRLDSRDYSDDWDRGASSTAPPVHQAPPQAPRRNARPSFPFARPSYDEYDRRRAEAERDWGNADFDEPDIYWQHRPCPASWTDRLCTAPRAREDAFCSSSSFSSANDLYFSTVCGGLSSTGDFCCRCCGPYFRTYFKS
ncbi:unnamed protein product [Symbiodinium necroappetens]|uniref:Uncharacterized protein n=1 Tax=Symbiodinium necroappetens TaxID=1628268 RepID=A0A813C657_9DINO|nr:unnamed protein product [Symbiodinium necroappetens]